MEKKFVLKIAAAVAYVAMVAVNYLANALPIGGVTTGEASDAYPNLFTPAGLTFSIWGLIYLLLLGYTLYQFGLGQKDRGAAREATFALVNKYFLLTSLANIAWIFAWHYGIIWLSVLIMLAFLALLIMIAGKVNAEAYSPREELFIRAPFSVYFGWITVATIANITVLLVSLGWNGFGLSDAVWTVIILFVGALIGTWRTLKDRNIYYGLVLVWAYGGILLKHSSAAGYNGAYPVVITAVIACLAVFLSAIGFVLYKNRKVVTGK